MQIIRTSQVLLCLLFFCFNKIEAQEIVKCFDDLINQVTAKSLTLRNGEIRLTQAKRAKLAAIYGVIEPSGGLTDSYTNNTKLPVNLIPSEILGGQPGTFQKVKFGAQYVTNINAYAEIKLLNLQGWEKLRLSKVNIQVNESDNKIALKNWQEDIAVVYFNIVTLQEQLKATELNLLAADTLYQFALQKFNNGIANQQDVNDSKVNKLNLEETKKQIQFLISQQFVALKILCDIPENEEIVIDQEIITALSNKSNIEKNALLSNNASIKETFAKSAYRQAKYSFTPIVSLFAAYQDQQFNTKSRLFDNNINWIPSNYVEVKLTILLPSSQALTQTSKAKYDYLLAKNNTDQMNMQVDLNTKLLQTDFEKAKSQFFSTDEIYSLQKDTYNKNILNYNEGVLTLEQTINSFNAMINSNFNYILSAINVLLADTKININTNIK
jgi:outer membrane protein TolC